jgi:hypothetical protein
MAVDLRLERGIQRQWWRDRGGEAALQERVLHVGGDVSLGVEQAEGCGDDA